jgi:CDP-diacylglycerol--glycerol-3-phosphate 3-phosphatidyltransferase
MPSVYDLKPAFQRLLRPLVAALAGAGVTANQVTVAAVVLSAAGGAAIASAPQARWPLLLIPPILLLRMAANAVDGMLAREHRQASPLGAVLNELGDVTSDALLYLPLALVPAIRPQLLVATVVAALATEMAGVVAVQIGASRRYDGPMGKSDRAAALGLVALLLGLGVPGGRWLDAVLVVVLVLALATVVQRARRALAEVGTTAPPSPAGPPKR